MSTRVWVTGVGAVTPLGATWELSVAALATGKTAIAPITRFDVEGFPSRTAAVVELDGPGDRRLAIARRAAAEAWDGARVDAPPERVGVFVGSEAGRPDLATVGRIARAIDEGDLPVLDSSTMSPGAVASALAAQVGAYGPVETVSLACASGAAAIAEAARALRADECDVALAGGVGADVDQLMLASFGLLGALSARGESCPFDIRRDGFVLGEGAAFVVLASDRPHDRRHALAELAGIGRTMDAHRLTAPDPDGAGAARAMRAALVDAGVERVDYIQAHGTSTPLNDASEALALQHVLGRSLERARVASVKGALGHAIAGAGAIGFACALEAVARGTLLPTAGLVTPDPRCALPHLTGTAVRARVDAALVNSFAFGGANVSLVVRRA
jgi:3-oxoacyl-[acyl-carrier-protein] synthase II